MQEPDEHALLRDASKASAAQSLLDNELLQEAFAKLEESYLKAWRNTDILDTIARERLHQAVNVLGKVQEHLRRIIDGGKVAKVQIDQIEGKRRLKAV